MFRKWLEHGENFEATEASIILERQKLSQLKQGWVELTVAEMVEKKFSVLLVLTVWTRKPVI